MGSGPPAATGSRERDGLGLFVLIALGESVAIIGAATGRHFGVASSVALAMSFVLACGLWWVHFHFAHDAVRHALDTAAVQLDIVRLVLSYGHVWFIAAIVALSVGLEEAIADPTEPLGWAAPESPSAAPSCSSRGSGSPAGRCSGWSRGPGSRPPSSHSWSCRSRPSPRRWSRSAR